MAKKIPAPVTPDQTVSEAFQTILRHNFNYLLEWEQAARSLENIKGVHQTRVAFRRMRSALFVFRSAVPRRVSKKWSNEIRYLAGQLGRARDLDVLLHEGLDAVEGKLTLRGQEKLAALVNQQREKAYESVNMMLDSERYAAFKTDFSVWIDEKEWEQGDLKKKNRKNLSLNIVPFSRELLGKLERKILGAGDTLSQKYADDMHLLRIKFKKLRYAAEFFVPVLEDLDDYIYHIKKLQDLLGIMNDVLVMQHLLESMLEEETDHELIEYAGGLVGWRTRQYYEMLDTFKDRLENLVNANRPW